MALKLVISDPESGLTVQRELDDNASKGFMGLKLGESVKGELIDVQGYEFLLTGGSDYCGFPMRADVPGVGRKKVLAHVGIGVRKDRRGMLQRKTVCGNTVHAKTAQVNVKVVRKGSGDIFADASKKREESLKKKEAAKSPAKAAEKPAGQTEGRKAEDKKAEVQEKKPDSKAER